MRRRLAPTAVLLAVALVAGACTMDDQLSERSLSADADAPEAEPEPVAPDAPDETPAEAAEDAGVPGQPVRPAGATLGRTVIRTASIELRVDDPSHAVDEVTRIAEDAGGFVATADLRRGEDGVLSGRVTVRVPSDDLLPTLDRLEELSDGPASRSIEEQDVTMEVADLEAQLDNLTTYEQELTQLLGDVREATGEPDDLLRVFERVREVRGEIDRLESRLTVLSDQVALSTVTVRITPAARATPVGDPGWSPADTVREAVTTLTRTLGSLADAAIWFVVAVLPVLALVTAPFAAVGALWWRRRRGRGDADGRPVEAPAPPSG